MIKINLIILFLISYVYCEIIDGPANIRETPNSSLLFTIYDNVEVSCTELNNEWFEIGIWISFTEEQFLKDPLILQKGTKLYNSDGVIIGETLTDLEIDSKSSGGPKESKWYGTELFGYTYKTNIKKESIVENAFLELINSNRNGLSMDIFKNHFKQFDYREGLGIPGYQNIISYQVLENWVDDPSPLDRLRLLFENDILIAVVHSRELNISNTESFDLERERKISILKTFVQDELENFINMNKKAYWGVD